MRRPTTVPRVEFIFYARVALEYLPSPLLTRGGSVLHSLSPLPQTLGNVFPFPRSMMVPFFLFIVALATEARLRVPSIRAARKRTSERRRGGGEGGETCRAWQASSGEEAGEVWQGKEVACKAQGAGASVYTQQA